VGTGCGILSILAAKKTSEVVATDVNPYAIHLARENALLNDAHGKVAFVRADLFTAFDKMAMFDVVLFNAPYLPSEKNEDQSWLASAWAGGSAGRDLIDSFLSEVPRHLKRTGRVFLMQSNLAGLDETLARFEYYGLKSSVVARCQVPFFETITLVRAELYNI